MRAIRSSGEGPNGSSSASASVGSVHCRGSPRGTSTRRQVRIALAVALMSPRPLNEAIAPSRDSIASVWRPASRAALAETNERLGAFSMSDWGERRARSGFASAASVSRPSALRPRERQESECRCLELGGLVCLTGRSCELDRR